MQNYLSILLNATRDYSKTWKNVEGIWMLLKERASLHVCTSLCYMAVKVDMTNCWLYPFHLQGSFCKLKFPCAYKSDIISNLSFSRNINIRNKARNKGRHSSSWCEPGLLEPAQTSLWALVFRDGVTVLKSAFPMSIKLYDLDIRQACAFRKLIKIQFCVISDRFLVSCFPYCLCVFFTPASLTSENLSLFTPAGLHLTHSCASERFVIETLPWAYGAKHMW